jgi:hypothetical protein
VRQLLGAVALILIVSAPARAPAHDGPPGPDGLPPAGPKHPWKVFSGVPRVDTLAYPQRDVIPAARRQLERDKWEIYSLDANRGEIVTKWKALHRPLLAIFMGKVRARCTVLIEPLGPDRSRMVFQGDLVSHRDLSRSSMIGACKRAYAAAARDYDKEVRRYLYARLSGTREKQRERDGAWGGHQKGVQISSAKDWEARP